MQTRRDARTTPLLDFSQLSPSELLALMKAMRTARDQSMDSGQWAEAELIRLLARTAFLAKWIPLQR